MSESLNKPRNSQAPKTELSASTEMNSESSVLSEMQGAPLSSCLLHQNCKTLSVRSFKECMCNGNFAVLVISGEPSEEQLLAAWNDIVFEWGCLIKTEQSEYLFDLKKRISELSWHVSYVDMAIPLLRHKYSQQVIDQLIGLGYYGPYNFDDHEQYHRALDRIYSLVKTVAFDLDTARDEYARFDISGEGKKQTEDDFDAWVSGLSRFQGYRINQDETMMTEFAGIVNAHIREAKARAKNTQDHG